MRWHTFVQAVAVSELQVLEQVETVQSHLRVELYLQLVVRLVVRILVFQTQSHKQARLIAVGAQEAVCIARQSAVTIGTAVTGLTLFLVLMLRQPQASPSPSVQVAQQAHQVQQAVAATYGLST
jgi:hypothetical protein